MKVVLCIVILFACTSVRADGGRKKCDSRARISVLLPPVGGEPTEVVVCPGNDVVTFVLEIKGDQVGPAVQIFSKLPFSWSRSKYPTLRIEAMNGMHGKLGKVFGTVMDWTLSHSTEIQIHFPANRKTPQRFVVDTARLPS